MQIAAKIVLNSKLCIVIKSSLQMYNFLVFNSSPICGIFCRYCLSTFKIEIQYFPRENNPIPRKMRNSNLFIWMARSFHIYRISFKMPLRDYSSKVPWRFSFRELTTILLLTVMPQLVKKILPCLFPCLEELEQSSSEQVLHVVLIINSVIHYDWSTNSNWWNSIYTFLNVKAPSL